MQLNEAPGAGNRVEVRDLPVRLFHWSLVLLVAFSWWAADQGGNWMGYHLWSGYAILTLILFRIGWGFMGSRHARFADFLYGLRVVFEFIKTLPQRQAIDYPGYNPLGGIKILLLLLVVLTQAVTGLFANDDIVTEGPLFHWVSKETSDWLTTLHKYGFDVLLALVAIHVAAQFFYLFYKRTDLMTPMFTGRRRTGIDGEEADQPKARLGVALALLLASTLVVWLLVGG